MEIPRTTSLRIDASRQSILDFPAEIRILIYEFLFKRDGHLLLHNRDAFFRKPGLLEEADAMAAYGEVAEVSQHVPEEDAEFRHGLGAGINLIATCRQIYYEASDTLYGQNDFVISRMVSTQHLHLTRSQNPSSDSDYAPGYDKFDLDRVIEYHPFFSAGQWVAKVGRNVRWLRKVKIDGDAVCECIYPSALEIEVEYGDLQH